MGESLSLNFLIAQKNGLKAKVAVVLLASYLIGGWDGWSRASFAWADSAAPQAIHEAIREVIQVPCAVVENFSGEIQIFDSNRTHMIDPHIKAPVACGSWISVIQGWVRLRHQNGPKVHLGPGTFIQFTEQKAEDQMLLYRGQAFVQVRNGEQEFRIDTPSARARMTLGRVILVFREPENETQLIALENTATLENRFETSRKVRVHAGETTSLNFKLLRVIPSAPSAISVASLKAKLADLEVAESEEFDAVRTAVRRQNRRIGVSVAEEKPKGLAERKLAGSSSESEGHSVSLGSYFRYQPDPIDAALESHWAERMVGGAPVGKSVLYPEEAVGKVKTGVSIEEVSQKSRAQRKPAAESDEEREKKKLIQELMQIHME